MPVLVLLSFVMGPFPLSLEFSGLEIGAVLLAVLIAAHVSQDGESTWFEGVQLLAVYVVLGDRLLLRLERRRRVVSSGSGSSSSSSSGSSSSGSSRAEERARRVSNASTSSSRLCSSIGRVVAEQDPLRAVVLFVLDQLEVDVGRVVDDQDDLGLGVEVGARTGEELVDVEAAQGRHGREATRPGREAPLDLGLDVQRLPARARRAARCGTPRTPGSRREGHRRARPARVVERQRRAPVGGAAGVGGVQQLRDPRRGRVVRRARRFAVERHARAADLVVGSRAPNASATATTPARTTTATITIGSASCTKVDCADRGPEGVPLTCVD